MPKKNAIFLVFQYSNTRRTRFDQSSPVQPVSEMQKSRKIKKKKYIFFFNKFCLELFLRKKIEERKKFCRKKCYPFSFPILGGRDSTRALQSSPFQKYENPKKISKITLKKLKLKKKKNCPLSFPILGGHDSTRALQSTPFQNPREVA